jgi:HAMP domain-containing protein
LHLAYGWTIGGGVYLDDIDAIFWSQLWRIGALVGAALVLVVGTSLLLGRSILKPIAGMTAAMRKIAEGDTTTAIPARDQGDEVGAMAQSVQIFMCRRSPRRQRSSPRRYPKIRLPAKPAPRPTRSWSPPNSSAAGPRNCGPMSIVFLSIFVRRRLVDAVLGANAVGHFESRCHFRAVSFRQGLRKLRNRYAGK